MPSVNKVILIGHLGADPESREVNGKTVANFRLATSESWNDKEGKRQEKTEWHTISVWGKAAEFVSEYAKKGHALYVEGRLQTREWEKDGTKRYSTEIVAHEVKLLTKKESGASRPESDEPF